MDHFTIFQDFYRVIAEMTEEEIVSVTPFCLKSIQTKKTARKIQVATITPEKVFSTFPTLSWEQWLYFFM